MVDEEASLSRLACAFLLVQAAGVFAWWIYLFAIPSGPSHFIGPHLPRSALRTYIVPDLAVYGGGGLLAAFLVGKRKRFAWPCLLVLTGGILYATLSTVALAFTSGGGWIGVPLMAASFAGTAFFAWRLRPRS